MITRLDALPRGVAKPPTVTPHGIDISIIEAALLFPTSPYPTYLSIAIAIGVIVVQTTKFVIIVDSSTDNKYQNITCDRTDVPIYRRNIVASRLSNPVAVHDEVIIIPLNTRIIELDANCDRIFCIGTI